MALTPIQRFYSGISEETSKPIQIISKQIFQMDKLLQLDMTYPIIFHF